MKPIKKLFAAVFAIVIIFTAVTINASADESTSGISEETATVPTTAETRPSGDEPKTVDDTGEEDTTKDKEKEKAEAKKTLDEQRKDLEARKKENEEKLKAFSKDAKATEEYINALDESIGYLNEELNLLDKEVEEANKKVKTLNLQIKALEKTQKDVQAQYDKAKKDYEELNAQFETTYELYCARMRALYISGDTGVLAILLTSGDISDFFTRLEMIKAVSKSDTELLKEVNRKIDAIVTKQDGLKSKETELKETKKELEEKQKELKKQQGIITQKQNEIATKKVKLAEDRATSDALFAEYAKNAKLYTEFRNEDEELIKQVDDEIDALIKGLKDPSEVTTVADPEHNPEDLGDDYEGDTELFSGSNGALSLGYPVPGYHGVSCPFGHYSNGRPHTGTDFPCPKGSKVVAAQKGIVITVKRLNYSYGYYVMIYHGTDAKGRKIVTLYAHNSSILVSPGQSVRKGQQIAKSGSTGNSTGPHCHFELIIDGVKVNAKNYLS